MCIIIVVVAQATDAEWDCIAGVLGKMTVDDAPSPTMPSLALMDRPPAPKTSLALVSAPRPPRMDRPPAPQTSLALVPLPRTQSKQHSEYPDVDSWMKEMEQEFGEVPSKFPSSTSSGIAIAFSNGSDPDLVAASACGFHAAGHQGISKAAKEARDKEGTSSRSGAQIRKRPAAAKPVAATPAAKAAKTVAATPKKEAHLQHIMRFPCVACAEGGWHHRSTRQ